MNHVETRRWDHARTDARAASSLPIDDLGYLDPRRPEQASPRLGGLLGLPAVWLERGRRRRALARISARDLKGAGLSLEAVEHELARPFWRPLDVERK